MKRLLPALVLFAAAPALAGSASDPFVAGDAEKGAAKAATCVACHGPAGNSTNPEWPKLAGQHSSYTYAQLKVLKSGERPSPVMNAQAAGLSDEDMKHLAAYFAAQAPQPGVASPESVDTAGPLYRWGDPERGLPACGACHGPRGLGNAAAGYPRIAGQHAAYTANVLRIFQAVADEPFPEGSPVKIMSAVAAKLKPAEIDALASYINGLQ